tara:strand:+ start:116429 stop:117271 length:843 start_codon:yes stop_codon:yes gene_type:complete
MTQRSLSDKEIQQYEEHGVVLVRQAVDEKWIDALTTVVNQQLSAPGTWANDSKSPASKIDRMFTDRYLWRENSTINDFIYNSGCAQLAAQAMGSNSSRFYFDHLLVKEPGTATPTPWHQDIPYWPFTGTQICSVWLALTPATVEGSSLEFVRGSHLDNKYYKAEVFGDKNSAKAWIGESQSEAVPDINAQRDAYDFVGWDVEPGDAIIFSAWVLHGAPGNASSDQRRAAISTRWLGDNATWQPHAGADPTVTQDDVCIQPGEPPHDDKVFPCIWSKSVRV